MKQTPATPGMRRLKLGALKGEIKIPWETDPEWWKGY